MNSTEKMLADLPDDVAAAIRKAAKAEAQATIERIRAEALIMGRAAYARTERKARP